MMFTSNTICEATTNDIIKKTAPEPTTKSLIKVARNWSFFDILLGAKFIVNILAHRYCVWIMGKLEIMRMCEK